MDPRLVRLYESGRANDEIAAILRLQPGGRLPSGVRLVSRFGDVVTIRLRRGDIPEVRAAVASMKAAMPVRSERRRSTSQKMARPGDFRRPREDPATGKGVVVGVIDWGLDFAHPDFRNADGSTRLLALWDQGADISPASSGYAYGKIHRPSDINAALASKNPYASLGYNPADSDLEGGGTHGTHVMGIAAGNGRAGGPLGVAPDAHLVFVHLTTLEQPESEVELADSATILEGVDFVRRVAGARPWAINLSMGQTGDQHDGTTLTEQGLDAALAEAPGRAIAQSAGNYWSSGLHCSGRLAPGGRNDIICQVKRNVETELEVWYTGRDRLTVQLYAPGGTRAAVAPPGVRAPISAGGKQVGRLFHRMQDPNNSDNHIVAFLDEDAPAGDWTLTLIGDDVADGRYHCWIQRGDDSGGTQSRFSRADADPYCTTGSICNGALTISTGAYDAHSGDCPLASFSSSGPTRDGRAKPDLVAPGMSVLSARSAPGPKDAGSGDLVRMSGTSMAAPHVTGTLALMFEAAGRPLRIEETRELVLSSARPPVSVALTPRHGRGYLDIDGAVKAARQWPSRRNQLHSERSTHMRFSQERSTYTAGPLALADQLVGLGGAYAASPEALLGRVLSGVSESSYTDALSSHSLLHPAAVFDTFTTGRMAGVKPHLTRVLEAVALPRQYLGRPRMGDLLVRRALGEPGIGHSAFIASSEGYSREAAQRRGWTLESNRPGVYVQVVEAGAFPHRLSDRFARRIATAEGFVPLDTLVLRPRGRQRLYGRAEADTPPDIDVNAAIQANRQFGTQLGWNAQTDRIGALLGLSATSGQTAFANAVAQWQADHSLPVDGIIGADTWAAMQPLLGPVPAGDGSGVTAQASPSSMFAQAPPAPAQPVGSAALAAPPQPVAPAAPTQALLRQDGIDVYGLNTLPSWANLRAAGISLVINKSSEGGIAQPDALFAGRYSDARTNGFIRGSFHYYRHVNNAGGDVQANQVVAQVRRLGPGDLAPAMDFEEAAVAAGSNEPATATAWRTELEAFLDTLETKLGRRPLIYTRRGAYNDHLRKADYRAADFAHFGDYPLWVLHYDVRFGTRTFHTKDQNGQPIDVVIQFDPDTDPKRTDPVYPAGAVGDQLFNQARAAFQQMALDEAERLYRNRQNINPPATEIPEPWGANWFLFQYSPFTPASMRIHHGFTDWKVDFSVTNGGVNLLRGMADLGYTAPHSVGNLRAIAYSEPDGRIHVLENLGGSWVDDVADNIPTATAAPLPRAAGDPTAGGLGNEQVIAYRTANDSVFAITRNIVGNQQSWQVTDITAINGGSAFGDPLILILQNTIHVIYWDQLNGHGHASRVNGAWQAERFVDTGAGNVSQVSGSGMAYAYQNGFHVVSRSRDAGHLFDFTAAGTPPQDLTAASHDSTGQMPPAATYRPATYTRNGQSPRIVFRALRGHIWQIERDTLNATNLTAAATAPNAAGSPTAVAADTAHVLYRGIDGRINDIFDDGGTWRTRAVCDNAASDPTAYIDEGGNAAATYRALDGGIRLARFMNGGWSCENAR